MVSFIDQHKPEYGVEPICGQLPIALSTYYEQKARRRDSQRLPSGVVRDEKLASEIERVHTENFGGYGMSMYIDFTMACP